jgi:transcriptional regulator with XRE-family HTH domain
MKRQALARRIRELREAHKKTQEEMAGVVGISRQAYIRLEKGAREIAFVEIEKIADYLGVPYTDITGVEEAEEPSLTAMCRNRGCSEDMLKVFQRVEMILGVFSGQERLFYRVREGEERQAELDGNQA